MQEGSCISLDSLVKCEKLRNFSKLLKFHTLYLPQASILECMCGTSLIYRNISNILPKCTTIKTCSYDFKTYLFIFYFFFCRIFKCFVVNFTHNFCQTFGLLVLFRFICPAGINRSKKKIPLYRKRNFLIWREELYINIYPGPTFHLRCALDKQKTTTTPSLFIFEQSGWSNQ
jgi:hypothetical protein